MKLEIVPKTSTHTPPSNFRDSVRKFHDDVERMQEALSWFQTELNLLQNRILALIESPNRRNG